MKSLYRAALGALLGGLIGFFAITPAFAGDHHDARVRKAAAAATSTPTAKTTASPTYTATPVAPVISNTTAKGKVTATVSGASFIITNTFDTPQVLTISLQSQPTGPYHRGLCKELPGQCHPIGKPYPVTIDPGTHTVTVDTSGSCAGQADMKDKRGHLVKSLHWFRECSTPTSSTSTSTTNTTTSSTPSRTSTHAKQTCDSDGKTQTTDDDCLAFTGATPLTRILMILGPAIIIGGAMMRFAPWSRARKH